MGESKSPTVQTVTALRQLLLLFEIAKRAVIASPQTVHVCHLDCVGRPFWHQFQLLLVSTSPCVLSGQRRHWVQGYPGDREARLR